MNPRYFYSITAALILGAVSIQVGATDSAKPAAKTEAVEAVPVFDEAFMNDPVNVAGGQKLWVSCAACHGSNAYPGKAPRLKPKRLKSTFIYKRVTKGFRKMPSWKAVFTPLERMQLVAYIKSRKFAP